MPDLGERLRRPDDECSGYRLPYARTIGLAFVSQRQGGTAAGSALEHALITCLDMSGRVLEPYWLRSDNGLVFTSRSYTALMRSSAPPPRAPHIDCSQPDLEDGLRLRCTIQRPVLLYTHTHRKLHSRVASH